MTRTSLRLREGAIKLLLQGCALLSIVVTLGIVWVLFTQSIPFFRHVAATEFLFGTRWAPLLTPQSFGILPLLCGTTLIAGGALLLAIPIGVATAVYLSEYAPPAVRQVAKPVLEVLAGVPTVVFGYFALLFVTPYVLRPLFPSTEIFNAASAAIVVAIMVIPTISSLCDDALRAVPRSLREAGFALAATRLEVSTRVVLPAAMSGVVASVLLAFARAIGETMAVSIAAGASPTLTLNPLRSVQTMTAYIVQVAKGDAPADSVEYDSIFAVGLVLFLMTFLINVAAQRVLARFREAYE
ncbi:MAG: hypothetical protein CHACPFDD_00786 [Phycisphaerae bacterium]|nr:hypothetical protein [Phycisphaerae bacterium]